MSLAEDEIAALKAAVKSEVKAEVQDEINVLRAELAEYKTLVDSFKKELSVIRGKPTNENNPTPKQASTEAPAHAHSAESLEPISYKEAFEKSGGQKTVEKYTALSRRLQDEVNNLQVAEEMKELMAGEFYRRKGFSTGLLNQGYVNRLDVLYKEAKIVYKDFDAAVQRIADATGGTAVVPPIKGEKRARMKAMFKYRDPHGDGIAWYRLTDLVRATIMYPTIESMYDSLEDVLKLFGANGNVVKEFNDRYNPGLPGGYRDIQLVVQFKEHMCEVQLNTEIMIQAKQTMGHRSFEVIRELKAAIGAGDVERVSNALEFGKESLGTSKNADANDEEGAMDSLKWLLREKGARNLIHDAAKGGHAEILHALLSYGADVNSVDENGNTPLHHAVQRGSERCVWAILDVADPDLDIVNNEGETALVKGYVMLWTRPPEDAMRAVTTLAQYSGLERMREARTRVEEIVSAKFQNSSQLVQHAGDGDIKRLNELLRDFKSPNSVLNGKLAIEAAIEGGQVEAIEVLSSFGAALVPHEGQMPLIEQAIAVGNAKTIQTLLDAGTPIDSQSFQTAIDKGDLEALNVLIESRPDGELESFGVWIDCSAENLHHIVQKAKGLQRNIYSKKHTSGTYLYQTVKKFDSSSSGEVILALNSKNQAHIALAEDEANGGKIYEIVFLDDDNNELRIRHEAINIQTTRLEFQAGPMREGEFCSIRISFDPTTIKVERYNVNGTWKLLAEYNREEHRHFQAIHFCRIASWENEIDWRSPLSDIHTAILCQDLISLQTLLLDSTNTSLEADHSGVPLMLTAIDVGDLEILKALKQAGAPLDSRAFQKVVDNKNVEALEILVESSSSSSSSPDGGSSSSPLHHIEVWTDSSDDDYWDAFFDDRFGSLTRHSFRTFHTNGKYLYQTVKKFDSSSSSSVGEVIMAINANTNPHIALAEDEANDGRIYEIVFAADDNNEFRLRHEAVQWNTTELNFPAGPTTTMTEAAGDDDDFYYYYSIRISFDPSTVKVEGYNNISSGGGSWELLTEYNREEHSHAINYCRIASWEHEIDWRVKV
ncbi:unnamed protein product [Cylindrotheca closterium]|uniref:Farnesoic acid O-methyl transferase domain-containing protein n=1 Tax=Cylindrotheca closterium TaxID=2856 RepID=A0AAD2JH21_9STRA|nr:unnamed protein product [Cylindrotheca closterium]